MGTQEHNSTTVNVAPKKTHEAFRRIENATDRKGSRAAKTTEVSGAPLGFTDRGKRLEMMGTAI